MERFNSNRNKLYRRHSRRNESNIRCNPFPNRNNLRQNFAGDYSDNWRRPNKSFTFENIVNKIEEIVEEEYSENIFETLPELQDQIKDVLDDEEKHDAIFSELMLKYINKVSIGRNLDEKFRNFLTLFLQSKFAKKRIDSLISSFLPINKNINIFHSLITFLKLTFVILPGLAFDMYYYRVKNLNILLEITYYRSNISSTAILELKELIMLASLSNPKEKVPVNKKPLPENYRKKNIIPTSADLLNTETKDIYLRKNKSKGKYISVDDYLDVQFRLMHEDFIQPLREGLKEYLSNPNKRNFNVRVYKNVKLLNTVPYRRFGIIQYIQLDKSRLKKVKWSQSKRLVYGSLLCFSCDDFKTLIFATVANRDDNDIKEGILAVKFLEAVPFTYQDYTILETMNMFEGYRHVLAKLQTTNEFNLPMKKYLVYAENDIELPNYITCDTVYFLNSRYRIKLNNPYTEWPNADSLQMNNSQCEAFKNALTKELTIIQGPPGTGKTYLGLKICSCLIQNLPDIGPILIVCYTNHALDQFLEGISTFTKNIVRVGGQSKSEIMKQFSLQNLRVKNGDLDVFKSRKKIVHTILSCLEEKINVQNNEFRCILQIEQLRLFMKDDHYKYLENFGIKKWLSGKCLSDFISDFDEFAEFLIEDILFEVIQEHFEKIFQCIFKSKEDYEEESSDSDNDVKYLNNQRLLDVDFNDVQNLSFRFGRMVRLHSKRNEQFIKTPETIKSRFLRNTLTQTNEMSEDEVRLIESLDNLSLENRWRLYQYWRFNYINFYKKRAEIFEKEYERNSDLLNKIQFKEDKYIMSNRCIIGMTTTGAARYSKALEKIGCKIIIVEEAAEVLESHIIGSLNSKCQHLILIGDHKQLRPNPAVYKLSVQYDLDLSLFERLINNNIECNTLLVQHRMSPEIADIIRFVYPDLEDALNISCYPSVPSIHTNIFFFNHSEIEELNEDIVSYTNKFEADLIVKLCHHLIENGVTRSEITILTLYSGQKFLINSLMNKKYFANVRVCVVDNYQGEENNIILLSLVRSNYEERIGFAGIDNRICVSLSRAKHGLYVFGNFDLLSSKSKLWKIICEFLIGKKCLGNSLNMFCQNHPQKLLTITTSSDFDKYPDWGCEELCNANLNCGHICRRYCHFLDKDHEEYQCMYDCTRFCPNGHNCLLKCYENCEGCIVKIDKVIPNCKHIQLMECSRKPKSSDCMNPCEKVLVCNHTCGKLCGEICGQCQINIQKVSSECGHISEYECCDDKVTCNIACNVSLSCGHTCKGTCGTCYIDKLHDKCNEMCNNELICGHICKNDCSSSCYPCKDICKEGCWHMQCSHICGIKCSLCTELCQWSCKHKACTMLCKELCNRNVCDEYCSAILTCNSCESNFQCYGTCGERCRSICYTCDPKIQNGKRYVTLWTCEHSFEVDYMDKYMYNSNDNDRIIKFKCPQCYTLLNERSTFRYMNIIKRISLNVKSVQDFILKEIKQFDIKSYKSTDNSVRNMFVRYNVNNYFILYDNIDSLHDIYFRLQFPYNNIIAYKFITSIRLLSILSEYQPMDLHSVKNIVRLIKWLNPNNRKFDVFEIEEFFKEFERIKSLNQRLTLRYSNVRNAFTSADALSVLHTERYFYLKDVQWFICVKNHIFHNRQSPPSGKCNICNQSCGFD